MKKQITWGKGYLPLSYLLLGLLLAGLLVACGDPTATPASVTTAAATTAASATTAAAATTAAPATTAAAATTAASATTAAAATTAASATTAAGAAPAGRLIVGVRAIPQNLDPIAGGEFGFAPQNYAHSAYIDTITRMDGAKVGPGLAVSWKQIDSLNWEFKLRKGIKFHNGEDFDSASVKFSMDTYRAQKAVFVRLVTVESYATPDAETFTVKTKAPDSLLAAKFSQITIVPAKYYAEKGAQGFAAAPVGTGPFQFVSYERDKSVTFKAFPGSWRGPAKIGEVVFRQLPDVAGQVQALKAGEIDLIAISTKDQYDDLKSKSFKVYDTTIGSTVVVDLETIKGGPLADKRVRQALNLAINKPEMIEGLFGKLTLPAVQMPSPVSFGYDASIKGQTYDVEKAKALLKDAGVKDGDLSLSIAYTAGAVGRKESVEALSQYYSKIGVKVTGQPLDSGTYFQRFNNNELGPAAIIARVYAPSNDGTLAMEWFTNQFSTPRYKNEDMDKLYAQALAEIDPTKRENLIKQMNKVLDDDAASIPLYYGFEMFASSSKIDGFKASPNGYLIVENVTKAS